MPEPVPYANLSNPQTLNLYAMVDDDPESFADLEGHEDNAAGSSGNVNGSCGGFLSCFSNALLSDNLAGAFRQDAPTTSGQIGAAVGDFVATAQGSGEVLFGGGEALVTAPAGATGIGLVIPAVGVGMAVHGTATAAEGFGHLVDGVIKQSEANSSSSSVDKTTPQNQERMKQGKPPLDKDGKPVELHHEGQNPNGRLKEMTRDEHRGPGNFKANHPNTGSKPSRIDRTKFAQQRKEHWQDPANQK